jgi:hypothetical protein
MEWKLRVCFGGLCYAIRLIVAANLRFAVKIQDSGKPEARRHEIRAKPRWAFSIGET